MTQRQHVISRWLLNRFAIDERAGLVLAVFDKAIGRFSSAVPSRFLALIDDHSPEVEAALGRLENEAARAVGRLLDRADAISPGPCPLYGDNDNLTEEPTLREVTNRPVEEMRLFAVRRWLGEPSRRDRLAIARYLGLMFTRAPKMELAILEVREAVREAYTDTVKAMAPALVEPTLAALERHLVDAAFIGLRTPEEQSEAFAAMPWYVVRAPDDEPFVLGDSPVVSTIQIGHEDDTWRPLLSEATYAVCMPLSSRVCLLVAPQGILPIGVAGADEIAAAINRLSWRWADRYVVGPTQASLEAVHDSVPAAEVASSVIVDFEPAKAYDRALLDARRVLEAEIGRIRTYGRDGGR